MTMQDDARRAVHAFFREEVGHFGPYMVSYLNAERASKHVSFQLEHEASGWILRLNPSLICWNDAKKIAQDILVFRVLRSDYGIPTPPPFNWTTTYTMLGPLGLAALRASITTVAP